MGYKAKPQSTALLRINNNLKQFLSVSITLLVVGLFVGGPSYYDNNVVRALWESGHFVLFCFSSFYLYTYSKLNRIDEIKRLILILGILFVAGFTAEVIQLFVGRDFETKDLLNNLFGIVAGLLIPYLRLKTHTGRTVLLWLLVVLLTFFSQRQLLSTIAQEVRLRQDFPVLSDFETSSQLERWMSDQGDLARLSISDSNVKDGRFSMCVELLPGKYPGITLKRLNRNWQDYQFIKLSIYLDEAHLLNLAIKVYDRQHPNSGYDYSDRFNGTLSLSPGWNDFSLPMHSIQNAPTGRTMNMRRIVSLSLFAVDLKQPVTFYLDSVQLAGRL